MPSGSTSDRAVARYTPPPRMPTTTGVIVFRMA